MNEEISKNVYLQESEIENGIFYIENTFHNFYEELEVLGEGTSACVKKGKCLKD